MKSKKLLFTHLKLLMSSLVITPIAVLAADHLMMTVAGQDFTGAQPPLVAAFTNDSPHWIVQTIPELLTQGRFLATSCTGNGDAAICIAAGQVMGNNQFPLLVINNNSSKWVMPKISGTLPRGFFNSTSCTGSGRTAICSITGHNASMNTPLLVTSTDGGRSWDMPTIRGVLPGYLFNSVSCTGKTNAAICVIGGEYQDNTLPPFLVTSTNGGRSFSVQTVSGLPTEGFFNSTSCTGEGSTAICVAVGRDITYHRPLLAVSTDGSQNWVVQSGLSVDGFLMSTSCTGECGTAVCIAVGKDLTNNRPLMVVSTDGGHHWFVQTIQGLSMDGIFNSTSCAGNGDTAICVAAGEDLITYSPLLVASHDGGHSWKIQSISGAPAKGSFFSTRCTDHGGTPTCIAAGENFVTGAPLFAQSIPHIMNWIMPSIVNLPLSGAFYGTGTN